MSGTDDTSVTLESLLLPNTPPSIRKNYLTLAQRAQEKDFGPLEEDLVVLDTETTGLSFKNCELLEIACTRLSGKKVVDRYHTFVRPKGLIPPEIVDLTGIHQSDVADAPSPADAVAGLAEFVGGDLVLAGPEAAAVAADDVADPLVQHVLQPLEALGHLPHGDGFHLVGQSASVVLAVVVSLHHRVDGGESFRRGSIRRHSSNARPSSA